MPRYYRRRATRVIRPKKKWSTNLVDLNVYVTNVSNTTVGIQKICENSTPSSSPTPVILKTGNFKLQMDSSFALNTAAGIDLSAYIMYVPEGFATTLNDWTKVKDFVLKHPEWILCWKYGSNDFITAVSGSNVQGNVDSIKVSSRLKRNLNSGDSIYLFVLAKTASGNSIQSAGFGGMIQFWTCAN